MTDLSAWQIGACIAKLRADINTLAWLLAEEKWNAQTRTTVTYTLGPYSQSYCYTNADWSCVHDYVADGEADDDIERPTQSALDNGTGC